MNQLANYPHLKWYVSNLRSIPGGSYRYGASPSQKRSGTRITMSPFRMGATPVTWGMWKEYRQSVTVPGKPIKLPEDPGWGYQDDQPVVNVSWDDIMEPGGFCEWASKTASIKFQLPSDAQWEYAARGGKDGLEYPWGNQFDSNRLWCYSSDSIIYSTAVVDRVNRIHKNGYGLTDMVGNVMEWCLDYHNADYRASGTNPIDKRNSKSRSARGGHFMVSYPNLFRCGIRFQGPPNGRMNVGGFRLVAPPK